MKKLLPILLAVLIGLSACAGKAASIDGEWKLISYGDANNPALALPDVETSFVFGTDNQFGGNAGCNGFGAGYKIDGDKITFESAFATMMYCEGVMDQEAAVLKIISEQTLNFALSGNQLTLTSQDGSSAIVLEKK